MWATGFGVLLLLPVQYVRWLSRIAHYAPSLSDKLPLEIALQSDKADSWDPSLIYANKTTFFYTGKLFVRNVPIFSHGINN